MNWSGQADNMLILNEILMKSLRCLLKALLIHLGLVTVLAASELTPLPAGSFSVASTNMEIADSYQDISDDEMHDYLLGNKSFWGSSKYVADILKYLTPLTNC